MSRTVPADWLVPDWPAAAGVRAACSVRTGGVSRPPWDSLNLGTHVGDDAGAVATNRARFAAALGARPVFLEQVHGSGVVELEASTDDGRVADACWTRARGVACTIMVADCLPVLLTDRAGTVVGAAHCGWRGLAGTQGRGVLEALWDQLAPRIAASREQAARDTLAWLGPCIGPGAFEVGPDVKAAFESARPDAAARFRAAAAGGKWLADLAGLARDRLGALGITAVSGNDGGTAWCTVSNPSRFFSHRRDRVSGRFAAAILLG